MTTTKSFDEEIEIEAIPHPNEFGCKHYYSYDVYWKGQRIVTGSHDPEHDAARVLTRAGVMGKVRVMDRKTGKWRSTLDARSAAGKRVSETRKGFSIQKWAPYPK